MPKTETKIIGQNWTWIDLENPTPQDLQALAEQYKLHPTSVKDCLQPEHLPKYEMIGNIVFIISRIYDETAHSESDTIQELTSKIAIFFSPEFLITIHRPRLTLVEHIRTDDIETNRVQTTFSLLLKVIRASLRTFEIPAQKLAHQLDFFEAKTFLQKNIPPLTKELYHLKRKAAVSKRVLQLSTVILDEIQNPGNSTPEMQDLRDFHLRLETMYDEINDSTNNLLNIYISLSSQKTNEVMRVLTVFSVFFMPLTFIVGIYGMNFKFMPELNSKIGYPVVMLTMLAVSIIIYFWFKRKGWL